VAAVLRLARERAWWPILPAAISWTFLFGYQWAFYFSYHGGQHTVFWYFSGVLGDGLFIPALNVAGVALLRRLRPSIAWRRLPLYALLGLAKRGWNSSTGRCRSHIAGARSGSSTSW
jgi:hypothetical protein